MAWRGAALSLLGALLGAALWVLILRIRSPFVLIGPAAAVAGLATGLGMRWGGGRSPALACAFSLLSVAVGRYATWMLWTTKMKLASGEWISPSPFGIRTLGYYARERLIPTRPWDIAIILAALAIAGTVAWRSAARR